MEKKRKIAIYTRISTENQKTDMQDQELQEYADRNGYEVFKKYHDTMSGSSKSRPSLDLLFQDAGKKKFNLVLVYKFDRFARSLKMLIDSLETFKNLGIDFVSLKENIDTTTPSGKLMFGITSAFAEFERDIIRQRVISGINARKAKGLSFGQPPLSKYIQEQVKELKKTGLSEIKIAKQLGISRGSVRKYSKTSSEISKKVIS